MNIFQINECAFDKLFADRQGEFKTCFVSTYMPNPRLNKRISAYVTRGRVDVICCRRESGRLWRTRISGVEYHVIDDVLPRSRDIVRRAAVSWRFRKNVQRYLHDIEPTFIYCTGLDSLWAACEYCRNDDSSNPHIIYEVSDLREDFMGESSNRLRRILGRFIVRKERDLVKYVDLLVVTSPQFFQKYYYKFIGKDRTIFIPNLPEERYFRGYRRKTEGEFTVGFIGGIRYLDQMEMMVDAVRLAGCKGIFAGGPFVLRDGEILKSYCGADRAISFLGRFDYDKQIADLYGHIDCVYAVYNADNRNVRMALPNKLYEAIVCELPIIVARGTYLSYIVDKLGVGVSVSHKDVYELTEAITRLRDDRGFYKRIAENCNRIKGNADVLCEFERNAGG